MRRIIPFWLICLCAVSAVSAKTHYRPGDWVSYSTFRFVRSMATDHRYVYFATTGGVSRYNLIENRWAAPLTTSDGLVDNEVVVVAVEPVFNELWCATQGGVSRYNPGVESWTTYRAGGGLFLDEVRSIGVAENARLVFETPDGAVVFDAGTNVWEVADRSGMQPDQGLLILRWYGARSQQQYKYPMFMTDFEYIFDPPHAIQDHTFRSYRLTGFLEDQFSNVWIATWGLNVGKASLRSLKMEMLRTGLVSRNVTAMAMDGDYIWFGGAEGFQDSGGITRLNRKTWEWAYFEPFYTEGLQTGDITAIAVDSSAVWFGTSGGAVWYDKVNRLWTTLPAQRLTSINVTALALGDSILWIGTSQGINRLDTRTRSIEPVLLPALRNLYVFDIAVDGDHSVWMATNRGVYRRRTDGVWKKIEDPNSANLNGRVFDIEMDGNMIWFGTTSSLLRFHRDSGVWDQWLLPIQAGGEVLRLHVSKRIVWLGTRDGAMRFDIAREKWTVYTVQDGLLNDTVQALLLDGNHIWFGTREGVTRFYWNDPGRLD